MAQALLHEGQNLGVPKGLGVDDPVGMQAHARKGRRKQVPAAQAPQHRAFETRQERRRKQSRASGMLARRARLHDLVHGPEREPAPGQMLVDRRDPERDRAPPRRQALEPFDLAPQAGKQTLSPGMCHALPYSLPRSLMFLFCSHDLGESIRHIALW